MRALIDTDVILDVFLQRPPFVIAASALWAANEQGKFEAFVSAITPVNAFYFVRKKADNAAARQAVGALLRAAGICPIDADVLRAAHALAITDYEDAVQHACAVAHGMDAIITRNLGDYRRATLPVFSPADFLAQLSQ